MKKKSRIVEIVEAVPITWHHCKRCHATKPESEFYASHIRGKGKGAWCKACHREYQKARYRADTFEATFRRIQKRAMLKKG